MSSFIFRLVQARETLAELNARTGSGPKAAWTVQDLEHSAGSFAGEENVEGCCPVCRNTVLASDIGNIIIHRDTFGKTCVASGLPFFAAVTA